MATSTQKNDSGNDRVCSAKGVLNTNEASCIERHVAGIRAVQYILHLDQKMDLVPYGFDWNGIKQPLNKLATASGKTITINAVAYPGQTVGLYLGSDALPEYRKELLYPVTVGVNDIKVTIQNKAGRQTQKAEVGPPVRTNVPSHHGDMVDEYEATLNGDIWMRFSHKYTQAEAQAMAAKMGETDAGLLAGLGLIYQGLVDKTKGLQVAFAGKHVCRATFQLDVDKNCTENIFTYNSATDFGRECLPRVHPYAWLAVLQAARDSGVVGMEVTSGWRPMTGAINHRSGVGLDIKNITDAQGKKVVFDTKTPQALWSSEAEHQAHTDWANSIGPDDAAQNELNGAATNAKRFGQKWNENARAYDYDKSKPGWQAARDSYDKAADKAEKTAGVRTGAKRDFDTSRKGTLSERFEQALLKNADLVRQVFSPVIIERETKSEDGNNRLAPNRLKDGLETGHNNHLHITIRHKDLRP